jgi:hypothetical protein
VLAELAEISQAIKQSAKSGETWPDDRPLPAFAWREYRAILAAHLPIAAWRWVESAYNEANGLNWQMAERNREYQSEGPVHDVNKEGLREPFEVVYQAMSELEQALGEDRGVFGYTGYAELADLEEGIWEPRAVNEESKD